MTPARPHLWLILVALASPSCWSGAPLNLPWPTDARSALLLVEGTNDIIAVEPGELQFVLSKKGILLSLFYEAPLSAYDLIPGKVTVPQQGGRALPVPMASARGKLGPNGLEWTQYILQPSDVLDYALPQMDLNACLTSGRCLSSDHERCEARDPDRPIAPVLVQSSCPWNAELSMQDCQPKVTVPELCGLGHRALWDEPACVEIARCPQDPLGYAEDAPTGAQVVYIQADGRPGDGTRALPFGSLQAAYTARGAQGSWVLGPGNFAANLQLDALADLSIIGACPTRTQISASDGFPVRVVDGRLRLRNLQVTSQSSNGIAAIDADLQIEDSVIGPANNAGLYAEVSTVVVSNSAFVEAPSGIRQIGGTLRVEDSTFVVGRAIACQDGTGLSVERSTMRGTFEQTGAEGINILQCLSSTVSEVRIADRGVFAPTGIRLYMNDVSIVHRTPENAGGGIIFGDPEGLEDPPQLRRAVLNKVYLQGIGVHGIEVDQGHLVGSHIVIRRTRESGIAVERKSDGLASAELSDIYVEDADEPSIYVSGPGRSIPGAQVTIQNLTCYRSSRATINAQSCVVVDSESSLDVLGMRVSDRHWSAAEISDADFTVQKLWVEGTEGISMDFSTDSHIEIQYADLGPSPVASILVRQNQGQVTLDSVHIYESEVGIQVQDAAQLSYSALHIEEASTCIDIERGAQIQSGGALLQCTGVGINYHDREDLLDALPGVKVDANPPLRQR